jgi:hypothetical protein
MVTIEETQLIFCARCRSFLGDSDAQPSCPHCFEYEDEDITDFVQSNAITEDLIEKKISVQQRNNDGVKSRWAGKHQN